MGLAIHLLGTPRVARDGQNMPAPRGRKVWGLLGALRWNLSELRRLLGNTDLRGHVLEFSLPPTSYVSFAGSPKHRNGVAVLPAAGL